MKYANKTEIAKLFGTSYNTVCRRERGIRKEIGKRYNQYAILGRLISVAVYADYEKYHEMLSTPHLRENVPQFSLIDAGEYLEGGQAYDLQRIPEFQTQQKQK